MVNSQPDAHLPAHGQVPTNICPSIAQRAPFDILNMIFSLLVFTTPVSDLRGNPFAGPTVLANMGYKSSASPFSASHVCMHWRRVALMSPKLWSELYVVWPTVSTIALTRLWLDRSKDQLLTLFLNQGFSSGSVSATHEIMKLFIDHVGRWKSFELDADINFEATIPPSPTLEVFKIVLSQSCISPERAAFWPRFLYSCSRLHTIVWGNYRVSVPLNNAKWDTIRNLTLYATHDLREFLGALNCFPNLEILTIHHQNIPYPVPPNTLPDVSLPCLKVFNVGNIGIELIFPHLFLPALTALTFRYDINERMSDKWNHIRGLLKQSACKLKSFSIQCTYAIKEYENTYTQNLKLPCFDSLETLELKFQRSSSTIRFGQCYLNNKPDTTVCTSKSGVKRAEFYVPKDLHGKVLPFDMDTAVRHAFSFEEDTLGSDSSTDPQHT